MISYWNVITLDHNDCDTFSNGIVKFYTEFPEEEVLKRLFKDKEIVYMRKIRKDIVIPQMLG